MSELYKIIQWVKANASVVPVAIARFSLRAGEDVSTITAATIANAAKVQKFKKIAEDVIGKPYV